MTIGPNGLAPQVKHPSIRFESRGQGQAMCVFYDWASVLYSCKGVALTSKGGDAKSSYCNRFLPRGASFGGELGDGLVCSQDRPGPPKSSLLSVEQWVCNAILFICFNFSGNAKLRRKKNKKPALQILQTTVKLGKLTSFCFWISPLNAQWEKKQDPGNNYTIRIESYDPSCKGSLYRCAKQHVLCS